MGFKRLFNWLTKPKSKNDDLVRREFILNVLLLGSILLSSVATISAKLSLSQVIQKGEIDQGFPVEITTAISLTFFALYFFSRAGKSRLVAHVFVWLCFIPAVYTSYIWGADVPQALLIYALIIIMAGILVGTKFALVMTVVSSLALFAFTYLQTKEIISVSSLWRARSFHLQDAGVYIATLAVIAIVSWLFNREIEKALHRARGSEKALKKERDLLEVKVEERTKELKKVQLEKVRHLYRLADFGRMTAGLFHDLVNPLTMVSLNLERLQARGLGARKRKVNNDTKKLIGRAVDGTRRMREFVKAVRKQIQKQKTEAYFSLNDEIAQVMEVIEHRTKELRVKLSLASTKKIRTYGNPFRFNQLVSNLACNAIDSYEKIRRRKNRKVIIALLTKNNKAILVVQDFGCGITKKDTKKIFDPFFTTKSIEKGTGIGLSICKDIAEKEFGGKIKVKSKEGEGATFTVEFPIKKRA